MVDIDRWMKERKKIDDMLYEKYGKPLEKRHSGKIVAIGSTGEVILGKDDVKVAEKAIKKFGSGNFAFKKVGYETFGKWLDAKS